MMNHAAAASSSDTSSHGYPKARLSLKNFVAQRLPCAVSPSAMGSRTKLRESSIAAAILSSNRCASSTDVHDMELWEKPRMSMNATIDCRNRGRPSLSKYAVGDSDMFP